MDKAVPIIGSNFPKITIPLIQHAKKEIKILIYDWIWYKQDPGSTIQKFNLEIIQKAKQGTSIKAILRNERTAEILNQNRVKAQVRNFHRMIHTKMILIDDDITIIGSHNYTKRAFELNQECSIVVQDEKINEIFKKYFNNLWL